MGGWGGWGVNVRLHWEPPEPLRIVIYSTKAASLLDGGRKQLIGALLFTTLVKSHSLSRPTVGFWLAVADHYEEVLRYGSLASTAWILGGVFGQPMFLGPNRHLTDTVSHPLNARASARSGACWKCALAVRMARKGQASKLETVWF